MITALDCLKHLCFFLILISFLSRRPPCYFLFEHLHINLTEILLPVLTFTYLIIQSSLCVMAVTQHQTSPPLSDSEKGIMTEKDQDSRFMEVNETGHVQELERNFSLFSICSVGIVTGNTWAALGGSIVVAIYNGGPPGVLYEFIAVSIFYWLVAASLAVSFLAILGTFGIDNQIGACFFYA